VEVACVHAIPGQLSPVREAGVMGQAIKWPLMHKLRKILKRIPQLGYSSILQMECNVCVINRQLEALREEEKNFP
jgi:ABC-type phosphate transport system auxiliary subunit